MEPEALGRLVAVIVIIICVVAFALALLRSRHR